MDEKYISLPKLHLDLDAVKSKKVRVGGMLLRESHSSYEVGEARVGAEAVEMWVSVQILQLNIMRLVGSFQRLKRLIFLA